MAKANDAPDKGGRAEEALRLYFQELGSFVVRGVPLRVGTEDVTDIDLWVYTRSSVHARHISIVDVKNKKRSKGFERAIWIKGLQAALGADEAIIATASNQGSVGPFASRLGVRLLSGSTLEAIVKRFGAASDRLSNEELFGRWKDIRLERAETAKSRIENAISELGMGISFSALNTWIDDAAFFFRETIQHERSAGDRMRAAYYCCSLVAIGADFLGRQSLFSDTETRRKIFRDGLVFGRTESDTPKSYVSFAEELVTEFLDSSGASAATIRAGFDRSVAHLPVAGLVDFFSKPAVGKELMDGAVALEAAAFAREIPPPRMLKREAKTIIGLVLDFADLPRQTLLGTGGATDHRRESGSGQGQQAIRFD